MNRQLPQTQNKTFIYSYDGNGNILSKKEYPYTTAEQITAEPTSTADYGYSDAEWKDKLTSYNGGTITYDANGNPLTYRDGMSFSWNGGRQLISLRNTSGTTTYYSYNEDGIRIMKNYGGAIRTRFLLDGTNIVAQEVTNGTSLDYEYFFYDASGSPVGMNYLGNNYLFKKNLQGDIIEIWGTEDGSSRSDFRKLVTYTYDAWGNITSMVDTTDNWYRVGTANPFRYRGYYYDNESGFYYVSSRYYDPEIGRWISPEPNVDYGEFDEGSGILGYNVYAYCFNNPVNNFDPDGEAVANIVGGVIGGVAGAALGYLLADALGLKGWKKWALISAATVGGAVLGAFLGPYMAKLGGKIAALTTKTAKIGTSFGKIGKLVKYRKITANWGKTTSYAFRRMAERGMSKSMVEGILRSGKVLQQSANKFVYITKKGAVVVEATGKIVTAYSSKYFDSTMQDIVKQLFG